MEIWVGWVRLTLESGRPTFGSGVRQTPQRLFLNALYSFPCRHLSLKIGTLRYSRKPICISMSVWVSMVLILTKYTGHLFGETPTRGFATSTNILTVGNGKYILKRAHQHSITFAMIISRESVYLG